MVILTDEPAPATNISLLVPKSRPPFSALTNRNVCLACRDADETKEWIEEKNQALNTDNYGHDLASVQALQRKHEGFERDLAALGDKVKDAESSSYLFLPKAEPSLGFCGAELPYFSLSSPRSTPSGTPRSA